MSRPFSSLLFFVVALPAIAAPLRAHVSLESPNGGEVLYLGSTFTIRWKQLVPHQTLNWDLWYSTTGANGPWVPIAMDIPVSQTSYVWNVPVSQGFSQSVRVRVRQDNVGFSYEDVSDGDLAFVPSLAATTHTVSIANGGEQPLGLSAGARNAGLVWVILGSFNGTSPGLSIGNFALPLNPDPYFLHTLSLPNTLPLPVSIGVLDKTGKAKAKFVLPAKALPPGYKGVVIHHAWVGLSPLDGKLRLISNAVPLLLVN